MSEDNRKQGQYLWAAGDLETREWFEKQWRIWPERADETLTTNLSLHYGGVLAYRTEHGRDPEMSDDFRKNIAFFDHEQKHPRMAIELWSTPRAPMHPVLGRRPSLPAAAPQPLTKRQKRRAKGKQP